MTWQRFTGALCLFTLSWAGHVGAKDVAWEEGPALPPAKIRDAGKAPISRVREHQYVHNEWIPETIPCAIRFTDRYFVYLTDHQYFSLTYKMRLQSACFPRSYANQLDEQPVRHDPQADRWVPDIEKYVRWMSGGPDPEYEAKVRAAVRVYPLESVNARGYAFTNEAVIGDEESRIRHFTYCLFRDEVALCGFGDVGYVAEGPAGDLSAYVLQLLRSVEFLPEPLKAADAPASAPSAAARAPRRGIRQPAAAPAPAPR